ncbi:hypothetical protein F5Y19DRAFT_439907 [Xylariaceae sp. FL1651]|nr:hypothetical protein F5Y19DRAFT_439907 [Xylariaceae sp. FL1651]
MAHASTPAQNCIFRTESRSFRHTDEVHNLDDPYLIPKLLNEPPAAGSTTCRFLAIPLNEPSLFSRNISQYGAIIYESRDRLIIRLHQKNLDLLDRVRQIWVSKYLAPYTECTITFDLTRPDQNSTIIIQCAVSVTDDVEASSTPKVSGNTSDVIVDKPPTMNDDSAAKQRLPRTAAYDKCDIPKTNQRVGNDDAITVSHFSLELPLITGIASRDIPSTIQRHSRTG